MESKKLVWLGWLLTIVPAAMLLMSGVMKLLKPEPVVESFPKLGWDISLATPLGILEIACTLIYLFPQTAVLGAILLTGYLGGAIATHVRIGERFEMQALFGVVIWLGVFLRDPRLRALIPFRT